MSLHGETQWVSIRGWPHSQACGCPVLTRGAQNNRLINRNRFITDLGITGYKCLV
ncbi:hypothetical protein Hanom_Chr04g00384761 [Helianthus anomalus]